MAETRKEKGIKQLTQMLTRWENWDDEFRQYIAWRMDSLKMLGAGNTSGILAVAVFLTTGNSKAGWMLGVAKVCLIYSLLALEDSSLPTERYTDARTTWKTACSPCAPVVTSKIKESKKVSRKR